MQAYLNIRNWFDWILSISLSLILYFDVFGWNIHNFIYRGDGRVFVSVSTISATLLGFSMASGSFLMTQMKSEELSLIKNSKGFSQLLEVLSSCFWRLFYLVIASLISLSIYGSEPKIALIVFVITALPAILSLGTLLWSLNAILRLTS
jgi:hypothetical protein